MKLGRMKEVDIRDLWKHEQYDFSNWLAKEENIEYLNDILGLTLVNIDKEVYVGGYRCDLVAKDETSSTKIIIENQLEPTNHDHLGKIITYASGLGASVIVWIVKEAREEHRSAIEWLNNMTSDEVNFFLIEIHAYKIGESDPAPYFKVVEEPNDFIKSNKSSKGSNGELNRAKSECFAFWTDFNEVLIEKGKPFNLRNGACYDEEKEVIHIHDRKLDQLEELIEESNGKPVLIAYWFKHDRDRILSRFKAREIKTDKDITDWNDGKVDIAFIHPASAGHGLNLQAGGSTLIWYGLTWSLELYQQCNARLHRQGQKNTVVIHHIIASGTIDALLHVKLPENPIII